MSEKEYYAHTKTNPAGVPAPQSDWQPLKDHLQNVAALAKKFAAEARPGENFMKKTCSAVSGGIIEDKIFLIRAQRVMIDRDLAQLYGVETKYLNRQVKRNILRFPPEFMFRLNRKETSELVTICHRFRTIKHSSSLPLAFTEHGVAMLASVLKSEQAIKISVNIIKTFVRLRQIIASNDKLAGKLRELESRINKHDGTIASILDAMRELMFPPEEPKKRIGFTTRERRVKYLAV